MFDSTEFEIDTPALRIRHHLAPWDVATVGAPVAVISALEVRLPDAARDDYAAFRDWCHREGVALASCRLSHARLAECGFLESQGFRYIELNYRPEAVLAAMDLDDEQGVEIGPARSEELLAIEEMAAQVFEAGRFHNDPMIDPRVGGLRYRAWIRNALQNPRQSVVACRVDDRVVAFFVVESPRNDQRHWSLVGLAPGLAGRGMGTRVWRAMLRWHRDQGVLGVTTSISSLNVRVFNLYVKLGFRFPAPEITLHWCPLGPVSGRR